MKKNSTLLSQAIGISALVGLMFTGYSASAAGRTNLSLGINYSSGNGGYGYQPPMFGYGAAGSSFLNCAGVGNQLGNFRPPQPSFSSLPPMPPLIPPHMQGGGGLYGGGGFGGAPYLPQNGCHSFCQPAMAYGPPQMMGPVPGGPMMYDGGGMMMAPNGGGGGGGGGGHFQSSGGYQVGGGGTTIIDMREKNEWEKSDTADIVWGAAIGMGMQTTNVFPFTGPRNAYTNLDFFYNQGGRPYDLQPRPHAGP